MEKYVMFVCVCVSVELYVCVFSLNFGWSSISKADGWA